MSRESDHGVSREPSPALTECPGCGKGTPAGTKTCPHCGTPTEPATAKQAGKGWYVARILGGLMLVVAFSLRVLLAYRLYPLFMVEVAHSAYLAHLLLMVSGMLLFSGSSIGIWWQERRCPAPTPPDNEKDTPEGRDEDEPDARARP